MKMIDASVIGSFRITSDGGTYLTGAKIIPMEQKRKIGMHLACGNNLCGTEKQARDASGRLK